MLKILLLGGMMTLSIILSAMDNDGVPTYTCNEENPAPDAAESIDFYEISGSFFVSYGYYNIAGERTTIARFGCAHVGNITSIENASVILKCSNRHYYVEAVADGDGSIDYAYLSNPFHGRPGGYAKRFSCRRR